MHVRQPRSLRAVALCGSCFQTDAIGGAYINTTSFRIPQTRTDRELGESLRILLSDFIHSIISVPTLLFRAVSSSRIDPVALLCRRASVAHATLLTC